MQALVTGATGFIGNGVALACDLLGPLADGLQAG
jgi:nucleoside-diphosphate-sugar epimerase